MVALCSGCALGAGCCCVPFLKPGSSFYREKGELPCLIRGTSRVFFKGHTVALLGPSVRTLRGSRCHSFHDFVSDFFSSCFMMMDVLIMDVLIMDVLTMDVFRLLLMANFFYCSNSTIF